MLSFAFGHVEVLMQAPVSFPLILAMACLLLSGCTPSAPNVVEQSLGVWGTEEQRKAALVEVFAASGARIKVLSLTSEDYYRDRPTWRPFGESASR